MSITNEQAQAWLVRADDAGRLAKALLEARDEVKRLERINQRMQKGLVDQGEQYAVEVQRLYARIPDPDDLLLAEHALTKLGEARHLDAAARLRAILEEA